VLLLKNQSGKWNHWVGLKLIGNAAIIDAIGARITWTVQGVTRSCSKHDGGSFMSSHDPRIVLGLGKATRIDKLEIRWPAPSTRVDRFENVSSDRYYLLLEGKDLR
jgi:hypothetical protein